LGNEIEFAQQCGVSRPTTRRAIAELVGRGLLVRKRGVGTQVVRGRIDRQVKLSSLFDDLARTQQHPKTRVLINEVTPGSDEVCARLRLPRRHPVLHLRRVRLVGDEPLAILENYLPDQAGAAAGGIGGGIGAADLTAVGLYQAMREAGVRMCVAKQRIAAREGTREECELLGEPAGSPLLTMERLTHDDSGRVVEWARHAYRPDRYAFTVTLVGR
jgi:DNA-binding GntR family transcriptional regulator